MSENNETESGTYVAADGREVEYTVSSGNVFADLGRPDADEMQFKSELVMQITRLMREKNLTQVELGALVGLPQPKVSELFNGRFRGFSVDRLLGIINRLGRDVEVRIGSVERAPGAAALRVEVAA